MQDRGYRVLGIYLPNLSEKGYEQRSDRGFGRCTEAKMERKAPPWRPTGLRCRCVQGFSDSFSSAPFLKGGIHKRVAEPPNREGEGPCRSCYALAHPRILRKSTRSANWLEAAMLPQTGSQERASSSSVGKVYAPPRSLRNSVLIRRPLGGASTASEHRRYRWTRRSPRCRAQAENNRARTLQDHRSGLQGATR